MENLKPNEGKNLEIKVDEEVYLRFPIKTHVIKKGDKLKDVVEKYLRPHLKKEDFIFISERMIAIIQGRAFPIKDIKPSRLANFLSRFVYKSPYGIGIGSPWTMELAIREVGVVRIFLGIIASVLTKPFGIRGVFYRVCGSKVSAIDGPCDYTLPPYNEYAKFGPKKPNKVAKDLEDLLGNKVVIIDANDLGVAVLGRSSKEISKQFAQKVFKDNPLGQGSETTPMCIVRKGG
ncbi:coenzyme F420-0:L-glutamate ligase [bacterium]|nr:coenzyme F420-0:L-glutamate ligase [bacterium]